MINKLQVSSSPNGERPRWITPAICILGVASGLLVIASRQGLGPGYLDVAGKVLYWTSVVFVTVMAVNTKELSLSAGKRYLALLALVHVILLAFAYKHLQSWSFITLTPLCLLQIVLFNIPFIRLNRKTS
jgi:hypothetical protein